MPVNPVRVRVSRILRKVADRHFLADESFPAEFPRGISGNLCPRFILHAVHRVPDPGVILCHGVVIPVEVCFSDNLDNPSFRPAGFPAQRYGAAVSRKNLRGAETRNQHNQITDCDPGVRADQLAFEIPGNPVNHVDEQHIQQHPDENGKGMLNLVVRDANQK